MHNPGYYLHLSKGLGRLAYYAGGFGGYYLPKGYFRSKRKRLLADLTSAERREADNRAEYYCRLPESADMSGLEETIGELRYPFGEKERHTVYFLDLYRVLRYFRSDLRFDYIFGDLRDEADRPTFVKSRPVTGGCTRSVLLKLNTLRHYRWVDDDGMDFASKKDMIVCRNHLAQPWRLEFVRKYFDNPRCDLGHASALPLPGTEPWAKPFMSVRDQLNYRFIACLEGNDVASNLKWVMSSNSLAVMPRPKVETWFAEGMLRGGEHYVEIKDDYSDLIERLDYYSSHPKEADEIIANAHRYIEKFRNDRLELATGLLTAERYFRMTGQM
ncbi:MAG: lipopolysaccharide A protein [Duncaniella sp.]|nr:lipopolysaccharide A protein [Duncaniella sp.]